jgi:hypothetical protein
MSAASSGRVACDLNRSGAEGQRAGDECSRRSAIVAFGDKDIDDLAVLVDGAVEVGPAPLDLLASRTIDDARLVNLY